MIHTSPLNRRCLGVLQLEGVDDIVGEDSGVTVTGAALLSLVIEGLASKAIPFPHRNCTPRRGRTFIPSRQGMSLPGFINTGTTT